MANAKIKLLNITTSEDLTQTYTGKEFALSDPQGKYSFTILSVGLGKTVIVEGKTNEFIVTNIITLPGAATVTSIKKLDANRVVTADLNLGTTAKSAFSIQTFKDSYFNASLDNISDSIIKSAEYSLIDLNGKITLTPDQIRNFIEMLRKGTLNELIPSMSEQVLNYVKNNTNVMSFISSTIIPKGILILKNSTFPNNQNPTFCQKIINKYLYTEFDQELINKLPSAIFDNINIKFAKGCSLKASNVYGVNSKITLQDNITVKGELKGQVNINGDNIVLDPDNTILNTSVITAASGKKVNLAGTTKESFKYNANVYNVPVSSGVLTVISGDFTQLPPAIPFTAKIVGSTPIFPQTFTVGNNTEIGYPIKDAEGSYVTKINIPNSITLIIDVSKNWQELQQYFSAVDQYRAENNLSYFKPTIIFKNAPQGFNPDSSTTSSTSTTSTSTSSSSTSTSFPVSTTSSSSTSLPTSTSTSTSSTSSTMGSSYIYNVSAQSITAGNGIYWEGGGYPYYIAAFNNYSGSGNPMATDSITYNVSGNGYCSTYNMVFINSIRAQCGGSGVYLFISGSGAYTQYGTYVSVLFSGGSGSGSGYYLYTSPAASLGDYTSFYTSGSSVGPYNVYAYSDPSGINLITFVVGLPGNSSLIQIYNQTSRVGTGNVYLRSMDSSSPYPNGQWSSNIYQIQRVVSSTSTSTTSTSSTSTSTSSSSTSSTMGGTSIDIYTLPTPNTL